MRGKRHLCMSSLKTPLKATRRSVKKEAGAAEGCQQRFKGNISHTLGSMGKVLSKNEVTMRASEQARGELRPTKESRQRHQKRKHFPEENVVLGHISSLSLKCGG